MSKTQTPQPPATKHIEDTTAITQSPQSRDTSKETWREYIELRKSYVEGEQKAYESYDKAILTLASSAFGVSLALAQYMGAAHGTTQNWLLAASWVGFIGSLLATLISFLASQRAFRRSQELLDEDYNGNSSHPQRSNRFDWLTDKLNMGSALLFLVGVIFLAIFVYVNLP